MSEHNCITSLVIEAGIDEIPRVTEAIEEAMWKCRFSDDAILDLQLAAEEAIANIILHGYREGSGEVDIDIRVSEEAAEVQIRDHAPPFNPLSVPDPDRSSDLSERHNGGLGIYLMRQVVDEVRYQYTGGKNVLTLIKKRTN